MPKTKTRRAAAKRFKITGKGKVLRRHAKMRHLLACKSPKKRRGLRGVGRVAAADMGRIQAMLPGG